MIFRHRISIEYDKESIKCTVSFDASEPFLEKRIIEFLDKENLSPDTPLTLKSENLTLNLSYERFLHALIVKL